MAKETVSIRMENPLIERIEAIQEEEGLSQTDAVRLLVRAGLEYDTFEERVGEMQENMATMRGQLQEQRAIIEDQRKTIEKLEKRIEKYEQRSVWDRLFS